MHNTKYVVFNEMTAIIIPIPNHATHANVRARGEGLPTSAGFVYFHAHDDIVIPVAFGESISLQLKSDPQDSYRIFQTLNPNTISKKEFFEIYEEITKPKLSSK